MITLRRWEWCTMSVAVICLVISIVTWVVFPATYAGQVIKNLQLVQHRDQSLSYSAFMMANPPIKNVMRFYFFNVTNPDEMIYNGEKPRLVESQSYAVM
ncbi:hypothetical protein V3C99_003184 [Haemonchus contortus]